MATMPPTIIYLCTAIIAIIPFIILFTLYYIIPTHRRSRQ